MNNENVKLKIFVYITTVICYIGLLANSIYRVYSGRNNTPVILAFFLLSHCFAAFSFAPTKQEDSQYRVAIKKSKKDKNKYRKYKKKNKSRKHSNCRDALLIIPTGIILTICFFGLFFIQKINTSDMIQIILSTGIHVPVILYLGSLVIHMIHKAVLNHYTAGSENLDDTILIKIIYCLSFYLDMMLLFLDWPLGIYIAVIIIGRVIWFDTVYTGQVIVTIKRHIHEITHTRILQITNEYGQRLFYTMLLLIGILQVCGN